jgi:hypothetical protein
MIAFTFNANPPGMVVDDRPIALSLVAPAVAGLG